MHDSAFRHSVRRIIAEKYDGDIFAYIKNLHDTIEILESTLENINDAYLKKAA